MEFSSQQKEALRRTEAWLRSSEQLFRLDGYAGTGKTTIARHLAEQVKGDVVFAAYTGKAASRLRAMGASNATTIHRLLYKPGGHSGQRLIELTEELEKIVDDPARTSRVRELHAEIAKEKRRIKQPNWQLEPGDRVRHAELVVIDEWSMVDERIHNDLCSVADKILYLGDPFQLPPVRGTSPIADLPVGMMLEEIHRQAAENPLLVAATRVRNGERLALGEQANEHGRFTHVPKAVTTWATYADTDVILVGRNNTRRAMNARWRERKGFKGLLEVGESVIMLSNDHDMGIYNGETAQATKVDIYDDEAYLDLSFADRVVAGVVAWTGPLQGKDWAYRPNRMQAIDYAYAITGHKYQGSETADVVVYAEGVGGTSFERWLYTCITRATKNCTVVQC